MKNYQNYVEMCCLVILLCWTLIHWILNGFALQQHKCSRSALLSQMMTVFLLHVVKHSETLILLKKHIMIYRKMSQRVKRKAGIAKSTTITMSQQFAVIRAELALIKVLDAQLTLALTRQTWALQLWELSVWYFYNATR